MDELLESVEDVKEYAKAIVNVVKTIADEDDDLTCKRIAEVWTKKMNEAEVKNEIRRELNRISRTLVTWWRNTTIEDIVNSTALAEQLALEIGTIAIMEDKELQLILAGKLRRSYTEALRTVVMLPRPTVDVPGSVAASSKSIVPGLIGVGIRIYDKVKASSNIREVFAHFELFTSAAGTRYFVLAFGVVTDHHPIPTKRVILGQVMDVESSLVDIISMHPGLMTVLRTESYYSGIVGTTYWNGLQPLAAARRLLEERFVSLLRALSFIKLREVRILKRRVTSKVSDTESESMTSTEVMLGVDQVVGFTMPAGWNITMLGAWTPPVGLGADLVTATEALNTLTGSST